MMKKFNDANVGLFVLLNSMPEPIFLQQRQ